MGNMPDTSAADNAQILATAPGYVAPVASPSDANDRWLADEINKVKLQDQEYAKLQSDQSRAEWEAITSANLQRKREQEQNRTEKTAAYAAQEQATADANDIRLIQHTDELIAHLERTYPNGWTEYSLPTELYADIAKTNQEFSASVERRGGSAPEYGAIPTNWPPRASDGVPNQPTPQTQQAEPQASPETFPDGQKYHLTNNPDGTIEVNLATGERFVGDPSTVMQKMAEAQVNTKLWAKSIQQKSQGNGNGSAPSGEVSDFGTWAADETARGLGFSDHNEMIQFGAQLREQQAKTNEFIENQQLASVAADFMQRCPDFPDNPFAHQALGQFVVKNGWDVTAENLEAAHAALVRQKVYAPLTVEEQNATWSNNMAADSRRAAGPPPPMLRSQAPDANQQSTNEWNEPLDRMRARLIRQQLQEKASSNSLEYR